MVERIALVAAGVCLAAGPACRRADRGAPAAPPVVARVDARVAAPAAPDAATGTDIAAAIAAGTHCFSYLNLEIPRAASRQMEQTVQRCAASVPAQKGLAAAHLRVQIEVNGRVRDVRPFDDGTEAIAGPLLGCIRTAAREWTVPNGKKQCIEVGPSFGLLPRDIVMPGPHHRDDLRADFKTSSWWAVCQEKGALVPRRVRLSSRRLPFDACFGDDGMDVKVQGCAKALFVARGLPVPTMPLQLASLAGDADAGAGRPWPVQPWPETVWSLLPNFDSGTVGADATFGGQTWRLEIDATGKGNVFLIVGGKRQWLLELGGDSVDVRWAGDLDGDGKLDLLIQDGDEGPDFFLFQSSAAREGEIVHAVATGFNSTC